MALTPANSYFQALADCINDDRRGAASSGRLFADVAYEALVKDPPCHAVSFSNLLDIAFLNCQLGHQADLMSRFGQPPLTLHWQEHFRIEALFWVEGSPGIHQHSFSGAFHVMQGSSVHTKWTFERQQELSDRLVLGHLTLQEAELLPEGATRPIVPGPCLIHSTYHLDLPTITIVVRTNRESDYGPQLSYFPPSLGVAMGELEPTIVRQAQLLRMLFRTGKHEDLFNLALRFLAVADPCAAFKCAFDTALLLPELGMRRKIIDATAQRFPALATALEPAITAQARREKILRIRKASPDTQLQFFLALLLNLSDRSQVLHLIQARYPAHEPSLLIAGWIRTLTKTVPGVGEIPESALSVIAAHLRSGDGLPDAISSRLSWLLAPLLTAA